MLLLAELVAVSGFQAATALLHSLQNLTTIVALVSQLFPLPEHDRQRVFLASESEIVAGQLPPSQQVVSLKINHTAMMLQKICPK